MESSGDCLVDLSEAHTFPSLIKLPLSQLQSFHTFAFPILSLLLPGTVRKPLGRVQLLHRVNPPQYALLISFNHFLCTALKQYIPQIYPLERSLAAKWKKHREKKPWKKQSWSKVVIFTSNYSQKTPSSPSYSNTGKMGHGKSLSQSCLWNHSGMWGKEMPCYLSDWRKKK